MMRESSEIPIREDCCTSATSVCCFVSLLEASTSWYSPSSAMTPTRIATSASIRVTPRCERKRLAIGEPQIERLRRLAESGEGPLRGAHVHGHELGDVGRGPRDRGRDPRYQVCRELLDSVGADIGIGVPAGSSRLRRSEINQPGGGLIPVRKVVGKGRRVRSNGDGETPVAPGITGQLLEFLADE